MKDSIVERIKSIIEIKSRSSRSFANNIGFSYSALNNYLLGKRTTIDSDLPCKIVSTYSDINARWLLTGKGDMLRNDIDRVEVEPEPISIERLFSIIESQQRTIENLSRK